MSVDRTLAVTRRVFQQLLRDHRSIAMVMVAPLLLLWILYVTFQEVPGVFDRVGSMLLGTFPFVMMFLVTSITMLRERNQGTLDRMMVSPIGRADIMVGYALAFLSVAAAQSVVALAWAHWVLDLPVRGNVMWALMIVLAISMYGTNLGLALSAFAQTEFQAVQFMPLFLLPQIFLAGLLVPVAKLPGWLEAISTVIPIRYSFDVLGRIMQRGESPWSGDLLWSTAVTLLVPVVLVGLGALTMRRSSLN